MSEQGPAGISVGEVASWWLSKIEKLHVSGLLMASTPCDRHDASGKLFC